MSLNLDLQSSLTLRFIATALSRTGLHGLSPREFEIFRMILDAKSTDEIASALNVSRKTVANYHYAIKSKLGVDSDIELLYLGLRQGLVEPVSLASPGNRS
jgi:DNA-binding CsgD family transcriptional regulator